METQDFCVTIWRQNFFASGKPQFLLWRSPTNWRRPSHITEDNLPYFKSTVSKYESQLQSTSTATFRLVFDQRAGNHSLLKLTLTISHHSTELGILRASSIETRQCSHPKHKTPAGAAVVAGYVSSQNREKWGLLRACLKPPLGTARKDYVGKSKSLRIFCYNLWDPINLGKDFATWRMAFGNGKIFGQQRA